MTKVRYIVGGFAIGLLFLLAEYLWRPSPPPLIVPGDVFAWAGEVVTREDGTRICTLTRDLRRQAVVYADDWCKDWTIPPPVSGTAIVDEGPNRNWVRTGPRGGVQLHVSNEWRP